MPRNKPYTAEYYASVLAAMAAVGGELPAGEVARIIGCHVGNVAVRMAWAIENGLVHRKYEGRRSFYAAGRNPALGAPAQASPPPDDVGDFLACACSDGELHLYGMPEANDDGSVTLSAAQARALASVLRGMPVGNGFETLGRPEIAAMLWSDGELVLNNLPKAQEDTGAVCLTNGERYLLRNLLVAA